MANIRTRKDYSIINHLVVSGRLFRVGICIKRINNDPFEERFLSFELSPTFSFPQTRSSATLTYVPRRMRIIGIGSLIKQPPASNSAETPSLCFYPSTNLSLSVPLTVTNLVKEIKVSGKSDQKPVPQKRVHRSVQ